MTTCTPRTIEVSLPRTLDENSTNELALTGHTHELRKASTTEAGIVKLEDSLTSTDSQKALTAKQGKVLAEAIAAITALNKNQEINKELDKALSYLASKYNASYSTLAVAEAYLYQHGDGSLIYVVNDPDITKTGLYFVEAGVLVKAPYDALSSSLTSVAFAALQKIMQGDAGEMVMYEGASFYTAATLNTKIAQTEQAIANIEDMAQLAIKELQDAIDIAAAAGAGANGWTASLVVDGDETQHQINSSLIRTVKNTNDLLLIQNPKNKQIIYVESVQKTFIYDSNLTTPENGVTVVGKWEMEIQEAYYASWFCPPSSINNVNDPQTDTINKAYRYATEKGRAFVIDHSYYVESIARKGTQAYPSLGGNDLLDYAIRVLSNSILIFKKGIGKLKLVPNNKTHSRVLCVFDVENYAIFDPECIGDKSTHLGTTGEQHYMIAFHASKNGYVRNPVCRNSWGDGFYFGYPEYVSIFNVDVDYPTNLVIDGAYIENSSRNGISLCGAENLTINNPVIDIVDRIAPMAGIDIEPEEDFVYSGKRMHLKNVKIHNLTVKNANNYGVMSFIVGNREIDVSFTGTTTFSAKAPYYCSFPIWHCSVRGSDLTEAQYTASGAINFEKVVMSDAQAQWHIVAPISFHSELGKVKLNISELIHTKHQAGAVGFGFENPTSVTASWSGGLSVGKITLNGVDVVELRGDNSASTPAKKLRYIDLPIPSYMQVGYESNKLQFENNVNIGGYARLNSKGWYNTNELINNTIFTPQVNPDDGNSIQARIYDLGEKSNGRTMVYSLESDLTTPQIGDGLYVYCGRLIRFTSPLSTATCEFQSNGLRKLKSSFGNFVIY